MDCDRAAACDLLFVCAQGKEVKLHFPSRSQNLFYLMAIPLCCVQFRSRGGLFFEYVRCSQPIKHFVLSLKFFSSRPLFHSINKRSCSNNSEQDLAASSIMRQKIFLSHDARHQNSESGLTEIFFILAYLCIALPGNTQYT